MKLQGSMNISTLSETVSLLAGGSFQNTSFTIPNAWVLGVATQVIETIVGVSSWRCGDTGNTVRYGDNLFPTQGTVTIRHTAHVSEALPIRIESGGGTFVSGSVRVIVQYLEVTNVT